MTMEIPEFLAHLPRHAGFPVPFIMLWVEGKPDFRAIDLHLVCRCYDEGLCGICGQPLADASYFIGGDGCKRNHIFLDPAMHFKCAEFSSRICPFLSGQREGYSDRPVPGNAPLTQRPGYVPENLFLFKSLTKWTTMRAEVNGGVAFRAGPWLSWSLIRGT